MNKGSRQKKWIGWATLGLSLAAIAISIIAICVSCPRDTELGFDYQGVIVGVLSLLITLLIGWNIYTFVDIKGTSKKIDDFRKEYERKMEMYRQDVEFDLRMEMMKTVPVIIARETGNIPNQLKRLFRAFYDSLDKSSLAEMMARESLLILLKTIISEDDGNLVNSIINELKGKLKIEEVNAFLHDFLRQDEVYRQQHYSGLEHVLLELMKAQA